MVSISREIPFIATLYDGLLIPGSPLGVPIEEDPIKNCFEIRLKAKRAYYAVCELLPHYDAKQTVFPLINHYIRFVDREPKKPKTYWKLNDHWTWFIGKDRTPIKLTTAPEELITE